MKYRRPYTRDKRRGKGTGSKPGVGSGSTSTRSSTAPNAVSTGVQSGSISKAPSSSETSRFDASANTRRLASLLSSTTLNTAQEEKTGQWGEVSETDSSRNEAMATLKGLLNIDQTEDSIMSGVDCMAITAKEEEEKKKKAHDTEKVMEFLLHLTRERYARYPERLDRGEEIQFAEVFNAELQGWEAFNGEYHKWPEVNCLICITPITSYNVKEFVQQLAPLQSLPCDVENIWKELHGKWKDPKYICDTILRALLGFMDSRLEALGAREEELAAEFKRIDI
ncbi:hypothetical protein NliqN6_2276 [Naganishia liquefaciens]|uniref:Uncharacterized protein n=1 Tax=Naganishia liquefaciens TaxID=104408 RepID=A0A8H3TRX1_9TREE|nr:hypothetical protein NliqN6_2276 [Naganishia liquefaciens]